MSWFAAKATSEFLGMKEDYVRDLENLLPEEEEEEEDYAALFARAFSTSMSEDRFSKINDDLLIWWINEAASLFVKEEKEPLDNPLPKDVVAAVSLRNEPALNMVGSTDLFCKIRDELIQVEGFRFLAVDGMAGIGKTALAKKILRDPLIFGKFECRVFVRMGPEYQVEEAMQVILSQMPDGDKIIMEGDEDIDNFFYETLNVRKCLVVLDDVWKQDPWYEKLDLARLHESSQSRFLVTTRIGRVAQYVGAKAYKVPFLNKEESWDLLREKIFGEKGCPRELEKAGKKIAENCEGLPLLILIVAGLLSKAEITLEYWGKVAENKTNSIFVDAYEQIYKVIYPSYYYLSQNLKACFLYLGVFPQNDEFRVSKLIRLWGTDGFLGVSYTFLRRYVGGFIREIVSDNVALGTQWSTISPGIKTCSLHSVFWYLCKREAWNEKFLLVLNSYKDASPEGIESRRRLSIYKNILLSIKDVRESIASMSFVRSLLCTGPYHQYEVHINLGLRLLKVLDVLTIHFYEFPIEVLKLVQLRFLALTCNGNLPSSISKLWGLQCLILYQHLSIKSSVMQSYLPVEIWDLQELEYLQIKGRNLPDPPPDVVLTNLLILLDVGAHTCNERVLGSIPNLEKLRVQIELMPGSTEPQSFYDDISLLEELTSLQCVIVNPEPMSVVVSRPASLDSYSFLRKLTLSGCGYPWEEMNEIAKLTFLEVLKLKCYAFRGEKWEVEEGEFQCLTYLSIEDTDLVKWNGGNRNFPLLQSLIMKDCYKLHEIPKLPSLMKEIRFVDCNPLAVSCAKQMVNSDYCSVYVDSSWTGDGKRS